MTVSAPTYRNHRYPIEIVARAVWLYFRFNLSLRGYCHVNWAAVACLTGWA